MYYEGQGVIGINCEINPIAFVDTTYLVGIADSISNQIVAAPNPNRSSGSRQIYLPKVPITSTRVSPRSVRRVTCIYYTDLSSRPAKMNLEGGLTVLLGLHG